MKKINSTFDEWKKDTDEPIFIGHNIMILMSQFWNIICLIIYFSYITRKSRGIL